jgi:hypothetical protein
MLGLLGYRAALEKECGYAGGTGWSLAGGDNGVWRTHFSRLTVRTREQRGLKRTRRTGVGKFTFDHI